MIVAKFGGTSVADAAAVSRVIEIVRSRRADQPVVVVSALARVTDALLALPREAETAEAIDAAITGLVERHEQIGTAIQVRPLPWTTFTPTPRSFAGSYWRSRGAGSVPPSWTPSPVGASSGAPDWSPQR